MQWPAGVDWLEANWVWGLPWARLWRDMPEVKKWLTVMSERRDLFSSSEQQKCMTDINCWYEANCLKHIHVTLIETWSKWGEEQIKKIFRWSELCELLNQLKHSKMVYYKGILLECWMNLLLSTWFTVSLIAFSSLANRPRCSADNAVRWLCSCIALSKQFILEEYH